MTTEGQSSFASIGLVRPSNRRDPNKKINFSKKKIGLTHPLLQDPLTPAAFRCGKPSETEIV
jgi:hypothetical protein